MNVDFRKPFEYNKPEGATREEAEAAYNKSTRKYYEQPGVLPEVGKDYPIPPHIDLAGILRGLERLKQLTQEEAIKSEILDALQEESKLPPSFDMAMKFNGFPIVTMNVTKGCLRSVDEFESYCFSPFRKEMGSRTGCRLVLDLRNLEYVLPGCALECVQHCSEWLQGGRLLDIVLVMPRSSTVSRTLMDDFVGCADYAWDELNFACVTRARDVGKKLDQFMKERKIG
ncbi:hypothetical protein [Sicyoidochytrium minutum DNA virus]|nr:hypothetical protein [Sicyoidochytrium minutum DNA virus]BDC17044.1 hypothetical protein [Sicyoidochytrium minutum DNA virus]